MGDRESCLRTIKNVFGDGEVVFDNMKVNLRDPLSFRRIKVPVKGKNCEHVQCFDAENYFQYQRTARNAKFKCFICHKELKRIDDIEIDIWFENILSNTKENTEVDQIEYFDDGTWKQFNDQDDSNSNGDKPHSPKVQAAA